MLKLNENLRIEKCTNNPNDPTVKIIGKRESIKKETNEVVIVDSEPRFYGTIYQALISVLEGSYDLDIDIRSQISEYIRLINEAKSFIKKEFRIEVLKSN